MGRVNVFVFKCFADTASLEDVDLKIREAFRHLFPNYKERTYAVFREAPLGFHMEYQIEDDSFDDITMRNKVLDNANIFFPYFYHVVNLEEFIDKKIEQVVNKTPEITFRSDVD